MKKYVVIVATENRITALGEAVVVDAENPEDALKKARILYDKKYGKYGDYLFILRDIHNID